METEVVLFDFDGVIANTEESNAAYLEKALAAFGIQLADEDRKALIGTNDKTRIESLLSRSSVKVTAEDLAGKRRQLGNTYENSCICPMPGVVSLIQDIRGRRLKTGLVTSTSTRLIMIALNRMKMTGLFDVIICGDMCANCKPDPECYKMAMDYLEAEPRKCIVFEDSAVGIHAARLAGARVAAYRGSGIQQDVSEADFIVDSYEVCRDRLDDILHGNQRDKFILPPSYLWDKI